MTQAKLPISPKRCPTPFEYWPQLDSLRGVAVLMVLWSHWMPHGYQLGIPWGHFGVQLFFVLSGYLITTILLRGTLQDGQIAALLTAFFARRLLRIFPAFYTLLLILCVVDFQYARENVLWHALYLTNFHIFWTNSFDSWLVHFWTLAVEEQFYLVWPLVICLMRRQKAVIVALLILCASPAFRVLMPMLLPDLESTVLLPSVADAFCAGALMTLLSKESKAASRFQLTVACIALPVFVVLQGTVVLHPISLEVESLRHSAMVLIFAHVISMAARGCSNMTGILLMNLGLRALGKISYGVYLYHQFAPHLCRVIQETAQGSPATVDHLPAPLKFALFFMVTLILACLSWLLIEAPCLRMKSHFPYPVKERAQLG